MREIAFFSEYVRNMKYPPACATGLRDIALPLGLLVLVHLAWSFYAEQSFPRQPMFGERNFVIIFQQAPLFFLASTLAVLLTRLQQRRLALLAIATFSIGSFPWFWKFYFVTTPWQFIGIFLIPGWLLCRLRRHDGRPQHASAKWFIIFALCGIVSALFAGVIDGSMLSFKNGLSKFAYLVLNIGTALVIVDLVLHGEVSANDVMSAAFVGVLIGLTSLAAGIGVFFFIDYPWMMPSGYGLMAFDTVKGFFGGTNSTAPFLYASFCLGLYLMSRGKPRMQLLGIIFVVVVPIFAVATGSRTLKILLPLVSLAAPLLFRRPMLLLALGWAVILTLVTYESRSLATAIPSVKVAYSIMFPFMSEKGTTATATSPPKLARAKSDPNFPEVTALGRLPGAKAVVSDPRRIQGWRRLAGYVAARPWVLFVGAGLGSRADLALEPNNDILAIVLPLGIGGLALLSYLLLPPFLQLLRDKPSAERSLWFMIWSGILASGLVYSFVMLSLWWVLYCVFSIHVQSGRVPPQSN